MTILIKNGDVVIDDKIQKLDILVENNKIVKVAKNITASASKTIDATGKTVMPGFVDMHCHLREPGQEYKEDIESGSKAAVKGGFTSVACMPNTTPAVDNAQIVSYIVNRAKEVNYAKVYPIGSITKGSKGSELAEMATMKEVGAIAVSDDGKPVADGNVMKLALEYADSFDILVFSHSEDPTISKDGVVNEGLNSTISGLKGISRVAEEAGIIRDILLAESLNTKIHIAHVSTKNSVNLIRDAKKRGAKVTCETCPHYFCATDEEILTFNTNSKINPPLREEKDVDAIIEGLIDGTIDVIATDHAPHHKDEKNQEFNFAPFGTSGFETAFALGYTHLVMQDCIDLPMLVKLMSTMPAKVLGLNTGEIKEGKPADIVIADLNKSYEVDVNKFVSKGKNSLFNGWNVTGVIETVLVDGDIKSL